MGNMLSTQYCKKSKKTNYNSLYRKANFLNKLTENFSKS